MNAALTLPFRFVTAACPVFADSIFSVAAVATTAWRHASSGRRHQWSASDTFEHGPPSSPGKAAEICGTIEPRLPVDWRFLANGTADVRHSSSFR